MIKKRLKSIKGYKTIPAVFRYGRRFTCPEATLAACFRPCKKVLIKKKHPAASITYLAVTISKKSAKRAVTRNRVKRLLRESVRITLNKLDFDDQFPLHLLVISWRKAPKLPRMISLQDIQPTVEKLIYNALDYYTNVFIRKQRRKPDSAKPVNETGEK